MISSLIAQIGMPILTTILSSALGAIDDPVTKAAAKALEKVDVAIQQGKITQEQMGEANRHAEKMAVIQTQENKARIEQINKSLRIEAASKDIYVRRMRPTFGYVMALTWAAQMLAVAYIIVFDPGKAGFVLNAISSLSAIWAVGLSVLGIYVYKRSEDKKMSDKDLISWNE